MSWLRKRKRYLEKQKSKWKKRRSLQPHKETPRRKKKDKVKMLRPPRVAARKEATRNSETLTSFLDVASVCMKARCCFLRSALDFHKHNFTLGSFHGIPCYHYYQSPFLNFFKNGKNTSRIGLFHSPILLIPELSNC